MKLKEIFAVGCGRCSSCSCDEVFKNLDQTGKSNNTLKTYCYALKQYFTYLEERKIDYKEVGVKDLADFVGWLRNPFESGKVTPLQQIEAKRTEKSVNLIITVVTSLYDYFFRIQETKTIW
jgi:site-specific recombinase XerD